MAKVQLEQWVNLNKDPKWVEDNIKSVERVGELHFEVTFNKAKLANFKIKVKDSGSNATYLPAESGRNKNFRIEHDAGSETNLGKQKVQLQRNVSLPAAGGNEYIVRVMFKGKQVESTKAVVVRRKLFYYSVKMDSATLPAAEAIADPSAVLSSLAPDHWLPSKNYYIEIKKLGDATMAFAKVLLMREQDENRQAIGNAWTSTRSGLLSAVKAGLVGQRADLQKRKPFAFVTVWCNYIASKGKTIATVGATTWTGSAFQVATATLPNWFGKLFNYKVADQTLYFQLNDWLWYRLDDNDDNNQHWLETCELHFVDSTGARSRVAIPNDRVSIAGNARFPFGGHHILKIDLTNADMDGVKRRILGQRQGTFQLRVAVRTVVGWTNGFEVPGVNVIVMADKVLWNTMDVDTKKQTLNHEFGHKIGMTSQGGKATTFNSASAANMPQAPGSLYGNVQRGASENARGHQGPHCDTGAAWAPGAYDPVSQTYAGTWSSSPSCVMFGANGIVDAANVLHSAPRVYCGVCEPIVRKLDLGSGMLGFASCVTD